eukprot:332387_1
MDLCESLALLGYGSAQLCCFHFFTTRGFSSIELVKIQSPVEDENIPTVQGRRRQVHFGNSHAFELALDMEETGSIFLGSDMGETGFDPAGHDDDGRLVKVGKKQRGLESFNFT